MHSRTAPSWDWGGRAPRSQTGSVRPRPRLQGPSNELMKILTIVTLREKIAITRVTVKNHGRTDLAQELKIVQEYHS